MATIYCTALCKGPLASNNNYYYAVISWDKQFVIFVGKLTVLP